MSDNDDFDDNKATNLSRKIEELEALLEQTKAASMATNIPVLDDLVEYDEESVVPSWSDSLAPDSQSFAPKITLPEPRLEMSNFNAFPPVLDEAVDFEEAEYTPEEDEPEEEEFTREPSEPEQTYSESINETPRADVDAILEQIEAKITHDLDTLVEILKDTIKDSVMAEIKAYLNSQNNEPDQ